MSNLEEFLMDKARQIHPSMFNHNEWFDLPKITYSEGISEDAINGDAWLKNKTSYIWKVGTLSLIDSNKCDWVYVLIGHKRGEHYECEFIGELYWQDGENDDIGRCLRRYIDVLSFTHPVFDAD